MSSGVSTFSWGARDYQRNSSSDGDASRVYYRNFFLAGSCFCVGDCVYLFPEDPCQRHFIGCITSAFMDSSLDAIDPHCVGVRAL